MITLFKQKLVLQWGIISIIVCALLLTLGAHSAMAAGTSYYVDCSAPSNGSGTQASPWNNLTTVNSRTFAAGDSLLFKRGTTCVGSFYFASAGTSTSRITIGDYGSGALPIINGNFSQAAVQLMNPSYVTMQNIEVKNGRTWGILATTNVAGVSTGLTLQNLVVHNVTGGSYVPKARKWTGLVVLAPGVKNLPQTDQDGGIQWKWERNTRFDQVLIDNVTAYDTTLWGGIFVWGIQLEGDMQWKNKALNRSLRSTNITIRNSTVHDTFGDGFAVYTSDNVLMENNVVYRSGMEPGNPANPAGGTIGTPVALWYWAADNVMAQFNEAYDNHSPGIDGGAFDLDYFSTNGNYQYNYAHDNSAYCVGVFGAEGEPTVNSIFRYNICAGNGVTATLVDGSPKEGRGEIYICTWANGSLDGVQVYNNTLYVTQTGAVDWCSGGTLILGSKPMTFRNNLIVSTLQNPYGIGLSLIPWSRNHNLWYYTGGTLAADPNPEPNGKYNQDPLVNSLGYHGIGKPTTQWTLKTGSPAINAGMDPCSGVAGCTPGTRDFFGNVIPQGGAFDIGAHESGGGGTSPTSTPTTAPTTGPSPTPTNAPPTSTPSASTLMHVQETYTTNSSGTPTDTFTRGNTVYWRARILDQNGAAVSGASVTTQLINPSGSVVKTYSATTDANGWALFSHKTNNPNPTGTYTINVTNVSKSGATYDPGANVDATHQFTLN